MTVADEAIQFMECLKLVGDDWGKPFLLQPWQRKFIKKLLKTDKQGNRITTKALLLAPRKACKSYLIAALCVYFLVASKDGQEIVCASGSQKQSARIHRYMSEIISQNVELKKLLAVTKHDIVCESKHNTFVAIASDGRFLHGTSPSILIIEELHIWNNTKGRVLWDSLVTGQGSRSEPLRIVITTQGDGDIHSLMHEEYTFAKNVKTDPEVQKKNPHYLSEIWELEPDDDPYLEANWWKCQPSLNFPTLLRYYREQAEEAKQIPTRRISFCRFLCNQLCDSATTWISREQWNACDAGNIAEELIGCPCYGGLDLASISDLASLALIFRWEDKWRVLSFSWCSTESIKRRTKNDGVPYQSWLNSGDLIGTPGESTDYDQIMADILKLHQRYPIQRLVADEYQGYQLCGQLLKAGIETEIYSQSIKSMNFPSKQLEKMVLDKTIEHDGNPILTYAISCATAKVMLNENYRIEKVQGGRLDPLISLIMAIGNAWGNEVVEEELPFMLDLTEAKA